MLRKSKQPIQILPRMRIHHLLIQVHIAAVPAVKVIHKIRRHLGHRIPIVKQCLPVAKNGGDQRSGTIVHPLAAVENLFFVLQERHFQLLLKFFHCVHLSAHQRKIHIQSVNNLRLPLGKLIVCKAGAQVFFRLFRFFYKVHHQWVLLLMVL